MAGKEYPRQNFEENKHYIQMGSADRIAIHLWTDLAVED